MNLPIIYDVLIGDCVEQMRNLDDESVNTCVTSPPYFGLRDYGVDGQIGLEDTPEAYVKRLVEVFREVRRVLRNDGTLWLNLGDSYGSFGGNTYTGFNQRWNGTGGAGSKQDATLIGVTGRKVDTGLRVKNLIGIPWRVAFALQADGWYLRQDIIWNKPNPMPESVRDRCTKAHEYLFLLSKEPRYYFDIEAIKEPASKGNAGSNFNTGKTGTHQMGRSSHKMRNDAGTRNRRSVWTVTTKPYKGAHFATFPPDLIKPCVLAGAPLGGVVLDPFGGSGTTAGVAVKHGRRAILCELNPDYVKLIPQRIESILK